MADAPAILNQMSVVSDATRARLMRVLERHELTVAELCSILQLPQSTTSRHLKSLAGGGWVTHRRDGTTSLYRMMLDDLSPPARKLWLLVREQINQTSAAEQDDRRTQRILAERQTKSQQFFSSEAGRWDHHRSELFGQRFDLAALPAALDRTAVIGDLGCGTGQMTETLAPFVNKVIAVDSSTAMLKAARKRLKRFDNVDIRRGDLTALPLDDNELDLAMLILVLHHVPEPQPALREAARALRPGGKLVVVDMLPHDHDEYQQTMGHLWLGFDPTKMTGWLVDAGLTDTNVTPLPTDAKAKGPALFAASGRAA